MKTLLLTILIITSSFIGNAQDVTTVRASEDISENLDLEAVASLFGESKDLEDFEYKLNDPELRISNLDLNKDGYVDYLRVLENSGNRTILITIQAVIGKDLYQDVATIDVEKDNRGIARVQVVGDVYLYGYDYIIEPVYVYSPPVVLYFWGSSYQRWYSPYYWQHYPVHYRPWHTCAYHDYHNHVHVHINTHHRYYYPRTRRSTVAHRIHKHTRRNDYGRAYPDRSFTARNSGVRNSYELQTRSSGTRVSSRNNSATSVRSTNSGVSSSTRSRNSGSVSSGRSSDRSQNSTRYSRPSSSRSSEVSRSGSSRSYNNKSSSSRSGSSRSYGTASSSSRSQHGQVRRSGSNQKVSKQNQRTNSGSRSEGRTRNSSSGSSKSSERGKRR